MYVCNDCGVKFDEPAIYEEDHGLDTPPKEKRPRCPACGSEDFSELHFCEICGEHKEYKDMSAEDDTVCLACFIATASLWARNKESLANSVLMPRQVRLLKDCEIF